MKLALVGFLYTVLIIPGMVSGYLDSYVGTNSQALDRKNETAAVFGSDHKGIDTTFRTEIFRVTGSSDSNALIEDNDMYMNKNPWMHFNDPWSRSGDHFVMTSYYKNSSILNMVMSLDRQNFTISKYQDIPNSPNGYPITAHNRNLWFDPNEELLMYGVTAYGAPHLYVYNAGDSPVTLGNKIIPPNSYLLLKNFSESVPYATGTGQGFMWNDGRTFSYDLVNSSYSPIGVGIYYWTDDPTSGTFNFINISGWDVYDENWADRKNYVVMAGANDGNYSHIPKGRYGIIRFDRNGDYVDSHWSQDYPYMSTGKASGYDGWWANRNGWAVSRTYLRDSTNITTFYQIWPPTNQSGEGIRDDPLGLGWSWAHNPSYSNADWIYAADYSNIGSGSTTKVGQDEVYAIDVKNPGTPSHWRRIARMWNVYNSSELSAYTNQPDCYGSPNNDYVMYWSNMRAAGEPTGRWDTFIAKIAYFHPADTNSDGCVEGPELTAFIDRWKVNSSDVTLRELIEAIGFWNRGCP